MEQGSGKGLEKVWNSMPDKGWEPCKMSSAEWCPFCLGLNVLIVLGNRPFQVRSLQVDDHQEHILLWLYTAWINQNNSGIFSFFIARLSNSQKKNMFFLFFVLLLMFGIYFLVKHLRKQDQEGWSCKRNMSVSSYQMWLLAICVENFLNSSRLSDSLNQAIGSDHCLLFVQHQAILWTNVGLLLIGPSGRNFSEISIEIQQFSVRKWFWKYFLLNGSHFISASMC